MFYSSTVIKKKKIFFVLIMFDITFSQVIMPIGKRIYDNCNIGKIPNYVQ